MFLTYFRKALERFFLFFVSYIQLLEELLPVAITTITKNKTL